MSEMKKYAMALIIILCAVATVNAQDKQENSWNLRFRENGDWTFFGEFGSQGWGGGFDYSKPFGESNAFWGAGAGILYSPEFGALSSVGGSIGYRFHLGKWGIAPIAKAGYGQSGKSQKFVKNDQTAWYDKNTSPWTPYTALELRLSRKVGSVDFFVSGGWKYNFKQVDNEFLPADWIEEPPVFYNKNWYMRLGLSFDLNNDKVGTGKYNGLNQYGGDNPFYVEGGVIYENGYWGGSGEFGHINRFAPRFAWERGFYFQWIDENSSISNEIGGFYGIRFLPWGASSWLTLSLGAQVGIGNYAISFKAETDDASFTHNQSVLGIFGGAAGGYVQANFRITPRLDIFVGAHAKYRVANEFKVSGDNNHHMVEGKYNPVDPCVLGGKVGFVFCF